jgi:hypothetical protein
MRRRRVVLPALVVAAALAAAAETTTPFSFVDAGPTAGLTAVTVFGGRETNRYLLETTGSGVAMLTLIEGTGAAPRGSR